MNISSRRRRGCPENGRTPVRWSAPWRISSDGRKRDRFSTSPEAASGKGRSPRYGETGHGFRGGVVVLVDTSVWIEVFRKPAQFDLEEIVSLDEVVTCLPVYQEILQGFRDERAFRVAADAMAALPMLEAPMAVEVFDLAVDIYRKARRAGLTVRSSVDCLVAACALRGGHDVLHIDRDYEAIARVFPLRTRMI